MDREALGNLDLDGKIKKSKEVIKEAFERFSLDNIVVAWTGGKDSTLLLWLVKKVCQQKGIRLPRLMFINEGYIFEEVLRFKARLEKEWGLEIVEVKNDDVLRLVTKPGDVVYVKDLSERNQIELGKLGFKDASFVWEPESYVGNHLMKTVAMNLFLEGHDIKAVMTGIRWDEQEARSDETFFSPRQNPDHMRVHPILHFKERDVWDVIHRERIPINPLYAQGFRSLGTKDTTTKTCDIPAWEQDLENTTEREGRRQDKEGIMARLRALGYM